MATKHSYLVFIEVPSTAPFFSEQGLNTHRKIRLVGKTKAINSCFACEKVSKKLGIPYNNLKALMVKFSGKGVKMDKHNVIKSTKDKYLYT